MYPTYASNHRQVPLGIVRPRDADDVVAAMRICAVHDAPVLALGAGTSLAGQAVSYLDEGDAAGDAEGAAEG